jgi:hypothetical protein
MKINTKDINSNGTSLRGYVTTTYKYLVEKLGEPSADRSGDGKVTCTWSIEFPDDTVATVYDWKTTSTPKESYDWHIGGRGVGVVEKVARLIGLEDKTRRCLY